MNVELFAQRIDEIHERLAEMYRGASASVPVKKQDLLLATAFKELGTASEELQVAAEEISQQTEELATTRSQVEAERQRYQDLFEFMPQAYLVTDVDGKIQEANRAAVALLNVDSLSLVGKPLIVFIPSQERREFRFKLSQLSSHNWVQEFSTQLQPRNGQPFEASLTVGANCDSAGRAIALRWIVRDITERKRLLNVHNSSEFNPSQDRPKHFYSRGEIIPLEPQTIWLVRKGLVKLSTVSETGEEIIVGLAGPSMPIGSGMTSLHTYQATALSADVELVGIALSEIAASPRLTQALFPKISDRLRQTEALLAIAGKRQVRERLYHLLLFLKQDFGQKVVQGTRLSVRLTHQDLADACCTTRVTITRLLGKLQKQGKIDFDAKQHIILKNDGS